MTSGSLTSSGWKGGTDIAGLNAFLARRRRCVEMVLSAEESKQGASGLNSNGLEGDRGIGWMFSLSSMLLNIWVPGPMSGVVWGLTTPEMGLGGGMGC